MSVRDKVVVVTGASSGIGAALAEQLGRGGARVVLVARSTDTLREVAERSGANAVAITADVTRREEVRRVVQSALEHFGRIDVWVNNVGRGISRAPSELTDDDVDAMIRDNVKTALYGMQEVLPHFRSRGEGQVINVSSMLGRVPHAIFRSAYSASKHFLNALTANFRTEVQTTHPNIQFTLVSPGVVATEFGNNAMHGGPDSRSLPNAQPVEEVAAAIVGAIESRRADVYTFPGARKWVMKYYARDEIV